MAVSEMGERLWADYQEFSKRDLGEYDIAYLFIDGIAECIRPGQRREPVLAAWGFSHSGAKILLSMMAGSKEDSETVSALFQDMPRGILRVNKIIPVSGRRNRLHLELRFAGPVDRSRLISRDLIQRGEN
jgi:transposase-like protein